MSEGSEEHHCDGVWVDLDAVKGAAGEGRVGSAAEAAERAGATGVLGAAALLERLPSDIELGRLSRGLPGSPDAADLLLVEAGAQEPHLERAAAWARQAGDALVLDEGLLEGSNGHDVETVTALWVHGAESNALEEVRSRETWTAFHGTLEPVTAFRHGAGALAGPIPLLGPGWALHLLDLAAEDLRAAQEAERRLLRWIETSLMPAARASGQLGDGRGRGALGALLLEVSGWLAVERTILGLQRPRLEDEIRTWAHDAGFPEDPLDSP